MCIKRNVLPRRFALCTNCLRFSIKVQRWRKECVLLFGLSHSQEYNYSRVINMRKTPLKRKSKTDLARVKEDLWQACRAFAKEKYKQKDGTHKCFTCDKPIEKSNCQLGHFIPNSTCGALLRYHPHNLRLQCYYDNINLGGNGSEFYRRLVIEHGQDYVDNLFRMKHKTVKADILFHQNLLVYYMKRDEDEIVRYLGQNGTF